MAAAPSKWLAARAVLVGLVAVSASVWLIHWLAEPVKPVVAAHKVDKQTSSFAERFPPTATVVTAPAKPAVCPAPKRATKPAAKPRPKP
jgi:hypothetical protein